MHHNVSYAGRNDPQRAAALDFVKWFGFRKARLLYRETKRLTWQQWSFACNFGGVQGFPVWNTWERWTGTVLPFDDA